MELLIGLVKAYKSCFQFSKTMDLHWKALLAPAIQSWRDVGAFPVTLWKWLISDWLEIGDPLSINLQEQVETRWTSLDLPWLAQHFKF